MKLTANNLRNSPIVRLLLRECYLLGLSSGIKVTRLATIGAVYDGLWAIDAPVRQIEKAGPKFQYSP